MQMQLKSLSQIAYNYEFKNVLQLIVQPYLVFHQTYSDN